MLYVTASQVGEAQRTLNRVEPTVLQDALRWGLLNEFVTVQDVREIGACIGGTTDWIDQYKVIASDRFKSNGYIKVATNRDYSTSPLYLDASFGLSSSDGGGSVAESLWVSCPDECMDSYGEVSYSSPYEGRTHSPVYHGKRKRVRELACSGWGSYGLGLATTSGMGESCWSSLGEEVYCGDDESRQWL